MKFFKRFFTLNNLFLILTLIIIFIFLFSNISFAAYPKLITTLNSAFHKIETWLVSLSTPAAAVAVRKWSFYEKS